MLTYTPPHISALSPSCGPVAGGTKVVAAGSEFKGGSHFMCHFGELLNATLLQTSALACTAPVLNASHGPSMSLSFELSLNGQQFTRDGFAWSYTSVPVVSSIFPTAGTSTGGTMITVSGAGFSHGCDLRCDFPGLLNTNATYAIESGSLLCASPLGVQAGRSCLEISLNGQQYSQNCINYTFFDVPTIDAVQPLSTPVFGGTILFISGAHLPDLSSLSCKVGDATVLPATHFSQTEIKCTTPPIASLFPLVSTVGMQSNFSTTPRGLHLGGNAQVDGGVLKLTGVNPAGWFQNLPGWAIAELAAPMPALWSWRVSFELYIGGGYGGDGFSFLYGDVSEFASLNEGGWLSAYGFSAAEPFSGLVVRLHTRGKYIDISYNGALVHMLNVHDALRTNSWIRVELVYDARGLSLFHDGWSSWTYGESSLAVQIPDWNPQRGWQFAFAASNSRWSDYHWLDNLVIESPWLERGPAVYELHVTVNGRHFLPAANITYTAPTAVSSLVPETGPAAGNTQLRVQGVNFRNGDNYTCRFDNVIVAAQLLMDGSIECFSPPTLRTNRGWRRGRSAFAISTNNQDYTEDVIFFSYLEPAIVSAVMPNAGPSLGGTLVRVSGSHFQGGDGYRCTFGNMPPVVAILRGASSSGHYLECMSPTLHALAEGEVSLPLEVTLNDQQYTDSMVLFRYFIQESIDTILPISGPVLGETSVLIRFGSVADSTEDSTFYFRFGNQLSVGVRLSDDQISCPSPASVLTGKVTVAVSANAQQFSNAAEFFYFAQPSISSISPTSGPVSAGTLVDVTGSNLQDGSAYMCSFGALRSPATYDVGEIIRIRCFSPLASSAGAHAFGISLNGQQFTTNEH